MKRKPFALALIIVLIALTGCPEEDRDDRTDVREIDTAELDETRNRIEETMLRGDPQEIADLFIENAYYSPLGGEVYTSRDEIRRAVERGPRTTEYSLQARDSGGAGDTAWEAGTWRQTAERAEGEQVSVRGTYLLVLERDQNGRTDDADVAIADDPDTAAVDDRDARADRPNGWRIRAAVANMPAEDAQRFQQLVEMEQVQPDTAAERPPAREPRVEDRPVQQPDPVDDADTPAEDEEPPADR